MFSDCWTCPRTAYQQDAEQISERAWKTYRYRAHKEMLRPTSTPIAIAPPPPFKLKGEQKMTASLSYKIKLCWNFSGRNPLRKRTFCSIVNEKKQIGLQATFVHIQAKLGQENLLRRVRWHCPPDTGYKIQTLEVWGRARYLWVRVDGEETFLFLSNRRDRETNPEL